ncbi:hypothetical protein GOP47_0004230 [Adiantum capillus-veneris]|uniref:Uncharacterized protein n=1 Tax=Adiantum capillus-veneris TaxID=13818 RepID=A0A9D4V7R5_ADICA|nr:hypothetical protein GOP47_0004230 [Adiantum capillus-veneris]
MLKVAHYDVFKKDYIKVFDQLLVQNAVLWTALLAGHAHRMTKRFVVSCFQDRALGPWVPIQIPGFLMAALP